MTRTHCNRCNQVIGTNEARYETYMQDFFEGFHLHIKVKRGEDCNLCSNCLKELICGLDFKTQEGLFGNSSS